MTYNEDLEYAKNIHRLIKALVDSSEDEGYSFIRYEVNSTTYSNFYYKEIVEGDDQKMYFRKILTYINTPNNNLVTDSTGTNYISLEDRSTSYVINVSKNCTQEYTYSTETWKSEEEHFQNSLIYDDDTNRNILVMKYIKDHFPSNMKYLRMQLNERIITELFKRILPDVID